MKDNIIVSMLKKANAQPFWFGGKGESYFWRATNIDDRIFAQRVWCDGVKNKDESYRYCLDVDGYLKQDIYADIVLDFVMYYSGEWYIGRGSAEGAFSDIAGPNDTGLFDILDAFGKTYAEFLNDVMFWYSVALEALPDYDGRLRVRNYCRLSDEERIAKHIIDRLAVDNEISVSQGNITFVWKLVESHGKIWFSKNTYHSYDAYVFCTSEYGSVDKEESDAYDALQDSILSCFAIDGWELSNEDNDPEAMLNIIGLTLEAV